MYKPLLRLSDSPVVEVEFCIRLYIILYVIRQVAEEVDACPFLQLVNGDGIVTKIFVGVLIVVMLRP